MHAPEAVHDVLGAVRRAHPRGARQLGGDAPLAANLIAMQTVLSIITMPVIWFACLRAGLF